eukprot:gene2992-3735_t
MPLARYSVLPILALGLLMPMASCQVAARKLQGGRRIPPASLQTAQYIVIAAKLRYVMDARDHAYQVKLHMHRDHIIWFSVSSWGIEVLRGRLLPDKLELLHLVEKWHKVYDYTDLQHFFTIPCTFDFIQAVLLGAFPHLAHVEVQRREIGRYVEMVQQQARWQYKASFLKHVDQLERVSIQDEKLHNKGRIGYAYTPDALLSLIKMSFGSFKLSLQYNRYKSYSLIGAMLFASVMLAASYAATMPSKTQFEQERKALVEKIQTINQILAQTESKKKANVGHLAALNKKIEANNLLINSLTKETKSINQQLSRYTKKSHALQNELTQLKEEYIRMLWLGSKSLHNLNLLVFIFSADSFHSLLQRLRATKQYTKIRRTHFQEIKKVDRQLRSQHILLEKQARRKKLLLQTRQRERQELDTLKQEQGKMMAHLNQQHGKLVKELKQEKAAMQHLDKLISDLVKKELLAKQAQERAAAAADNPIYQPKLSAADRSLASQFAQNRGKLPWPVKTGFISSKFGIQMHPVLPNVQVENLGIDIQTQEQATVYAIFTGVVKTISFVPGMHQIVIIQHGEYHTVYAKLASVMVKVGQRVQVQEPIGIIYTNKNGVSELQVQIWKGIQKLNPAVWLGPPPKL